MIFLMIKRLNGDNILMPLKRNPCGYPRLGEIVICNPPVGDDKIHAKVNKVRWHLDDESVRIHAVELKPEERDS